MRGTRRLALLLGLAGWVSTAQGEDELARLSHGFQPDAALRGFHSDFSDDDPIGRFMDLLAEGAIVEARGLQPQACAAWTQGRSTSPLTGRFFVDGVELSLDRLCGVVTPKPG